LEAVFGSGGKCEGPSCSAAADFLALPERLRAPPLPLPPPPLPPLPPPLLPPARLWRRSSELPPALPPDLEPPAECICCWALLGGTPSIPEMVGDVLSDAANPQSPNPIRLRDGIQPTRASERETYASCTPFVAGAGSVKSCFHSHCRHRRYRRSCHCRFLAVYHGFRCRSGLRRVAVVATGPSCCNRHTERRSGTEERLAPGCRTLEAAEPRPRAEVDSSCHHHQVRIRTRAGRSKREREHVVLVVLVMRTCGRRFRPSSARGSVGRRASGLVPTRRPLAPRPPSRTR